jgi:hypothetical protein
MTVAYWSCKVFWYQTPSLRALECSRCESRRIADASPFALTIERPISVEDSDARTRVDILHPSKINAIGRMVTVLVVDGKSPTAWKTPLRFFPTLLLLLIKFEPAVYAGTVKLKKQ